MFGKMGDMMGMLSQLKEAQKNIEKVKKELDSEYLTQFSNDEKLKLTVAISGRIESIDILGEYSNNTELQTALKENLNAILSQARAQYESRLSENAMEGMPDMSGLLGK